MNSTAREGEPRPDHPVEIVLLLDTGGQVTWASASSAGPDVDPAFLIGQPAAEWFGPSDADRFRAGQASAMLRPGTPVTLESLQLRLGGALAFSDATLTCFPVESGHSGVVVTVRVHHLAGQPALMGSRESEERLRQVIRLSGIGTFEHNHLTGEIYWSAENRRIYGASASGALDFLSRTEPPRTWDLIHPDDRKRVMEAVRAAHAGQDGGLFDIEYRIVRADGTTRWLVTRAQTFFEGSGHDRHPVRTVGAVQDVTMHRQAARQLQLMQTSVDRCNTAIYWIDVHGRVRYANDFACTSLGWSRDELLSLHVWDIDPELSAETWARTWEQAKRRPPGEIQSRHRRKDGSTFPVELLGTYVETDGEELSFVFARDITRRELVERERRLMHAAIEKSHTPFYTTTRDGRIVYANEHACQMLGTTRAHLLTLHVWDIDPSRTPESQQAAWDLLESEGMLRSERTHRRIDGTLVPVEVTRNFISFKDEEFSLVFVQDLTERTRVERALRRSEERLRQAVLIYDIGIFEHDLITDTVECSEEVRRYLSLGDQETVPFATFDAALDPAQRENREQSMQDAHDPKGDGKLKAQFRIIRPDGSALWLESRTQTFFAGEGENRRAVRVVGAMANITERRNSEQRVNQKQRLEAIGTLAGGIAHDLNNALTPILMTIDLLKAQYPAETETLDTVAQCASRAAQMLKHLLAFARGGEGIRELVSPGRLIDEIALIVTRTFPKNIALRIQMEEDLPSVRGDPTQLHQVLLNLAVNARDAMPRGGVIEIEASALDRDAAREVPELRDSKLSRYVVISVKDSGVGIPAEVVDRIFEPFFTTKKPDRGTGLGLFTVAGIVRGHGGQIRVRSEPEQGSTFSVFLPAADRRIDAQMRRLVRDDFKGNGEPVLYVDDEAAVCEAARLVLQRLNFKPITAPDGRAGLVAALENERALCAVITDFNMPVMGGFAFIRALRKVLPDVPVIVASGRPDALRVSDLKELGIHVVLEKPFTEERLAVALQRALHSARASRSAGSGAQ